MKNKGLFITIEGPDGSGKSTLLTSIKQWLDFHDYDYVATKEPGSPLNAICYSLRKFILDPKNDIHSEAEIFLYLADRCQHVNEVILPALNSGQIILCDRYIDSTYAYQGWGRRHGRAEDLLRINYLNEITTGGLIPDLTILVMVDPEVGIKRTTKTEFGEPDRLEREKIDFHKRLCDGYRHLYENKGDRNIFLIDTTDITKEETATKAIEFLENYSALKKIITFK